MEKINLKRKRIMTYFVDATDEIIEKEGIEKVTIRKVADKTGYNSATIYNYFENLDHLIMFGAMKSIKDYALALPDYLKNANNALDIFLMVWECFCYYSFKNPKIYHAIFFADLNNNLEDYVSEYYKLYPEELTTKYKGIPTMLLKHNIYERGIATVNQCVKEGFIKEENAEDLNEMGTLLYSGILLDVMKGKINSDDALKKTMRYIKIILDSLLIK